MIEGAIGFLVAVTVGMTGVGGGSLTTPMLVLALALPAGEAVGTAMIFSAVLRLVAAPVYVFRRSFHLPSLRMLLLGAVPGVLAGTWLLSRMGGNAWNSIGLIAVGVVLALSSAVTFLSNRRFSELFHRRPFWLSAFALPIGMETGFSSAGAGALGTILLMNCSRLTATEIVGTDLLFGLVLALIGGLFHLSAGTVSVTVLVRLLSGGVPGVLLGCWLARRMPAGKLRTALAVAVIILGIQLTWKGVSSVMKPASAGRISQVVPEQGTSTRTQPAK